MAERMNARVRDFLLDYFADRDRAFRRRGRHPRGDCRGLGLNVCPDCVTETEVGNDRSPNTGKHHWIGKPSVLIFDVNETLIDVESMNPLFKCVFGDECVLREWFGQLILYSITSTLSGLSMILMDRGCSRCCVTRQGQGLQAGRHRVLKEGLLTMPAHADVKKGLEQLKDAGFWMVTLTNSPHIKVGKTPLENAGLAYFSSGSSASKAARAYKPVQVLYHMVAQELKAPSACWIIRRHVWILSGAECGYGRRLAHKARQRAPLPCATAAVNVVVPDLPALATKVIQLWRS